MYFPVKAEKQAQFRDIDEDIQQAEKESIEEIRNKKVEIVFSNTVAKESAVMVHF